MMTHTYTVLGMTCSSCQSKVQELLQKVNGVETVSIDLSKAEAAIDMHRHIPVKDLQNALKAYPKYQLMENGSQQRMDAPSEEMDNKSWFITYKPILLIFAYISSITLLFEIGQGGFSTMRWMNHFMAGFFIVFSFFKMLNLQGFADSYQTYDIVAKKWKNWSYIYAFAELGLGLSFLFGIYPLFTNSLTLVLMSVSLVGVLQSVLSKRKIKCACLGDVFNLPMSTVTIIEDGLMVAMSAVMLIDILL